MFLWMIFIAKSTKNKENKKKKQNKESTKPKIRNKNDICQQEHRGKKNKNIN